MSQINKLIYQIEVKTKKLLSGPLTGDYKNRTKGAGFDFDQLREYQQGDDVRYIDWKSYAKTNELLVRQYLEDRNRNVYILVDISASIFYGSQENLKSNLVFELASILSFIFLHNKDAVGLILFTDQIELYIPPKSSRIHVINMIKKIFSFKPVLKKTDINMVLNFVSKLKKTKRALVCLISDFMCDLNKKVVRLASQKHELIAFKCNDNRELSFPDVGVLNFQDIETKDKYMVNTSGINKSLNTWQKQQEKLLASAKVNCFSADTSNSSSFSLELVRFLRRRVIN